MKTYPIMRYVCGVLGLAVLEIWQVRALAVAVPQETALFVVLARGTSRVDGFALCRLGIAAAEDAVALQTGCQGGIGNAVDGERADFMRAAGQRCNRRAFAATTGFFR